MQHQDLNRGFLGINLQYVVDDHIQLRTIGLVELTEAHRGRLMKIFYIFFNCWVNNF